MINKQQHILKNMHLQGLQIAQRKIKIETAQFGCSSNKFTEMLLAVKEFDYKRVLDIKSHHEL